MNRNDSPVAAFVCVMGVLAVLSFGAAKAEENGTLGQLLGERYEIRETFEVNGLIHFFYLWKAGGSDVYVCAVDARGALGRADQVNSHRKMLDQFEESERKSTVTNSTPRTEQEIEEWFNELVGSQKENPTRGSEAGR